MSFLPNISIINFAVAHPYVSGVLATYVGLQTGFINPAGWLVGGGIRAVKEEISTIDPKRVIKAYTEFMKDFGNANLNILDDFTWGVTGTILKNFSPLGLAYIGGLVATPLALNFIYEWFKHQIGKPKMAIKSRHFTWYNVYNPFSSIHSQEKAPEPIFNAVTTRRINEIIASTKNIKANNGYFQNVLLWGPGGTGKTMISEMMAINSDLNYDMMSGGQLGQFIKRGEHVSELNRLFARAKRAEKPTIIFIDECEALCRKRDELDQEHTEILDTLLNHTGTPDKKVMVIMATNRLKDLDEAVLSRLDHKLYIGPPELEERMKIIEMYAKQFFANFPDDMQRFFNQAAIRKLAWEINGFTGRSIFKMLNHIASKKAAHANNILTDEMIKQAVEDFNSQEQLIENKLNQKVIPLAPVLAQVPYDIQKHFGKTFIKRLTIPLKV